MRNYDPNRFPTAVVGLLLVIVLVFVMQGFDRFGQFWQLYLWPLGDRFSIVQLVTYSFFHGSLLHLLSNALGLWIFGTELERLWGSATFLKYYFACVVSAGVLHLLVMSTMVANPAPVIGASGGLFGVLLAFAMIFPNRKIMLLIPPIPIKAGLFVLLYGLFELYAGITGTLSGIAHFAHLGGMVGGIFLMLYWKEVARTRNLY